MPKSQAPRTKQKSSKKKTGSYQSHEVQTQDPKFDKPTPLYVPVAAVASIIAGLVIIVLNFLSVLPQAPQPQYNIVSLALMSFGFIVSTQIR